MLPFCSLLGGKFDSSIFLNWPQVRWAAACTQRTGCFPQRAEGLAWRSGRLWWWPLLLHVPIAGSVLVAACLAWASGARDVHSKVNWIYFLLSPVRLVALSTFHCSLRASKAADFCVSKVSKPAVLAVHFNKVIYVAKNELGLKEIRCVYLVCNIFVLQIAPF